MCHAFEQEYWLRRAEEIRREMRAHEERLKRPHPAETAAPPKPAAPPADAIAPHVPEPIPG